MNDALILALDIGGTNARGEVVDRELNVSASAWLPIPARDGEATLSTIETLSRMLLAQIPDSEQAHVRAIGLGVPGIVDGESGIVRLAANLGWLDTPVADELEKRLGLPVVLHHDVTVAGLAERERGAGQNVTDLVAVFIGTGVAATIVTGGVPLRGGLHQAGELGHVSVHDDGLECPCGQRGCLEMYCSARSIGAAYARATGRANATSLDVVTALGADPAADEVWSDALDALALGLAGVITLLAPERIVIGGGLSAAGETLLKPLRERLVARVRVGTVPPIVVAELGQRAGIIGSALATFQSLGADVAVAG